MDWSQRFGVKALIGLQLVHNPNLVSDIRSYLGLKLSEDEVNRKLKELIDKGQIGTYERLIVLTDRIELIKHLEVVSQHIAGLGFEFEIAGQEMEVKGFDRDIEALRLYLALTCVDISGKDNSIKAVLTKEKPFLKDVKRRLRENLTVVSKTEESNSVDTIAGYLYKIRNKYTHEGYRFFTSPAAFPQIQLIFPVFGPHQMEEIESSSDPLSMALKMVWDREAELLIINPGFNLVDEMLEMAKLVAKNELFL